RSASLQRTFKKSFTSFSHSTRNKTRDGLIRVRNIRALNGRFNTSITHAYSIVIGSKHITLNANGGGFLTASKPFIHCANSKYRLHNTIPHAYNIVIGSIHTILNPPGGGFLTSSKQYRHGATSKSRRNTASNSTKHKSPHLSGWRQIISLIT